MFCSSVVKPHPLSPEAPKRNTSLILSSTQDADMHTVFKRLRNIPGFIINVPSPSSKSPPPCRSLRFPPLVVVEGLAPKTQLELSRTPLQLNKLSVQSSSLRYGFFWLGFKIYNEIRILTNPLRPTGLVIFDLAYLILTSLISAPPFPNAAKI